MRIAKVRQQDIANGPGLRVTVYVQGCTRHCDGCFNPETWDFDGGHKFTDLLMKKIAEIGSDKHIAGYSILGGEPMQQDEDLIKLLKYLKESDGKPIWMWTGYTWEQLSDEQRKILEYVDILVDGPFIESKKDPTLRFRGSSNQRIIDVQASLRCNGIVYLQGIYELK